MFFKRPDPKNEVSDPKIEVSEPKIGQEDAEGIETRLVHTTGQCPPTPSAVEHVRLKVNFKHSGDPREPDLGGRGSL